MKSLKITFVTLFLVLALAVPSLAGSGAAPSYMVYPGHVQSVDWNPALLGMSPNRFDLHLDLVDLGLWTNAWTPAQVIDYMNEDYWDEEIKDNILGNISGNSLDLGLNHRSGLYLGIGNWSLNQKVKVHAYGGVDKKIFETILHGITMDDWEKFELKNNRVQGLAVADTGFHMAFPLEDFAYDLGWEDLYVGGGLHYLYGIAWAEANIEGTLEVDEDFQVSGEGKGEALFSVTGIEGGGGHGFATDIGVWGQISPKLGAGISVTNLGLLRWDGVQGIDLEAALEADMEKIMQGLLDGDEEIDDDWYDYDFTDMDDVDFEAKDSQTRPTPFAIQAGAHYELYSRMHLAGSMGFKMEPVPHGSFSLGSRFFFPKWLPLTVSLDYATYRGSPTISSSLELHLGPLKTKLSLSDLKLIGAYGNDVSIGISSSIRF